MREVKRSALLPYTATQMFDLVADVERYPEFLSVVLGATVLAREGEMVTAQLALSRGRASARFTTRNRLVPGQFLEMRLLEGPFRSLEGRWDFVAIGEAVSRVELAIAFETQGSLAGIVLGPVFEGICNRGADPQGHRRQTAPDDPRRALERGREGLGRLEDLRRQSLRRRRNDDAQAGAREGVGVLQLRGTGRIRGVYLQQNVQVRPIFEAWMKPFEDLGMTQLSPRSTMGSDHGGLDLVGIPACQWIQDPIDYGTRVHHTNLDVFDHLVPEDLVQTAVITASFVYHTAMRDEMLPRKPLPPPYKYPVRR